MFRPAPHSVVGDRGKELGAAASAHGSLVGSSSKKSREIDFGTPLGSGLWPTTGNTLRTVNITICTAERDDTDPKENPTSLSTCGLAHEILCFVASPTLCGVCSVVH
jgi:hypothetical protein